MPQLAMASPLPVVPLRLALLACLVVPGCHSHSSREVSASGRPRVFFDEKRHE
jgi:hypothetical protein